MNERVNERNNQEQNMSEHDNIIEHVLMRLNKIDKNMDSVGSALARVDVYIGKSDALQSRLDEVLKRYGDRLDKHDDRIREIELINAQTAPYVSMIERIVWVSIVLAVTAVSKFADFS